METNPSPLSLVPVSCEPCVRLARGCDCAMDALRAHRTPCGTWYYCSVSTSHSAEAEQEFDGPALPNLFVDTSPFSDLRRHATFDHILNGVVSGLVIVADDALVAFVAGLIPVLIKILRV